MHPKAVPPFTIEKHGYVWIILDANGINWVTGLNGATLFESEADARQHMESISCNLK